jgi:prophage regulatory protein
MTPKRFLRKAAVISMTGLSQSSIYEKMACNEFPRPVPLGAKAVAWIEDEILKWQVEKIANRDRLADQRNSRIAEREVA